MTIRVAALTIYPIKSAAGVDVESLDIEARGPRGDRRWMIVDDDGRFVTQRKDPALALVRAGLDGDELTLTVPGHESTRVRVPTDGDVLDVTVWDDTVPARVADSHASEMLSDFIGRPVSLVWMPESTHRPVRPDYGEDGDVVSFADGFPYLLIGQGSLDDLNARLDEPIDMRRFRPNIVVSSNEPFVEDTWQSVSIGGIAFDVLKPCTRCTMTTVDQDTGDKGPEPLRTLATYRRGDDGKVLFGQNLIARGTGSIRVGDPVESLIR